MHGRNLVWLSQTLPKIKTDCNKFTKIILLRKNHIDVRHTMIYLGLNWPNRITMQKIFSILLASNCLKFSCSFVVQYFKICCYSTYIYIKPIIPNLHILSQLTCQGRVGPDNEFSNCSELLSCGISTKAKNNAIKNLIFLNTFQSKISFSKINIFRG